MRFARVALLLLLANAASAQLLTVTPRVPWPGDPFLVKVMGAAENGCAPNAPIVTRGLKITLAMTTPTTGRCGPFVVWEYTVQITPGYVPGLYPLEVTLDGLPYAAATVHVPAIGQFLTYPSAGSERGGTVVLIERLGSPMCTQCNPPPVVTFAGLPSPKVELLDIFFLRVTVPPHPPGLVDVVIEDRNFRLESKQHFRYFAEDVRDPLLFEPVLFPTLYRGPGAYGSQWDAVGTIRNSFHVSLATRQPVGATPVGGGQTMTIEPDVRGAGRIVDLVRELTRRASFQLLVRETSRQSSSYGVEVPIARERDFRHTELLFLNVPRDPRFRTMLRLYSIDGPVRAAVRVGAADADDFAQKVSRTVQLAEGAADEPAFASIDLGSIPAPESAIHDRLHVQVFGQYPRRLWGFVTVVNVETQQLTVITAQPEVPNEPLP